MPEYRQQPLILCAGTYRNTQAAGTKGHFRTVADDDLLVNQVLENSLCIWLCVTPIRAKLNKQEIGIGRMNDLNAGQCPQILGQKLPFGYYLPDHPVLVGLVSQGLQRQGLGRCGNVVGWLYFVQHRNQFGEAKHMPSRRPASPQALEKVCSTTRFGYSASLPVQEGVSVKSM